MLILNNLMGIQLLRQNFILGNSKVMNQRVVEYPAERHDVETVAREGNADHHCDVGIWKVMGDCMVKHWHKYHHISISLGKKIKKQFHGCFKDNKFDYSFWFILPHSCINLIWRVFL